MWLPLVQLFPLVISLHHISSMTVVIPSFLNLICNPLLKNFERTKSCPKAYKLFCVRKISRDLMSVRCSTLKKIQSPTNVVGDVDKDAHPVWNQGSYWKHLTKDGAFVCCAAERHPKRTRHWNATLSSFQIRNDVIRIGM